MKLKLCSKCKRPYLESEEFCPHCPTPYTWEQENWMNVGCIVLMILPVFLAIVFWFFFFMGIIFR